MHSNSGNGSMLNTTVLKNEIKWMLDAQPENQLQEVNAGVAHLPSRTRKLLEPGSLPDVRPSKKYFQVRLAWKEQT